MASFSLEPLHSDFGAHGSGIDFKKPITDSGVLEDLRRAVDEYSFLCFPGQALQDKEHLEFTRYLGEPEPNHVKLGQQGIVDYFSSVGNVEEDGTVLSSKHKRTIFLTGNNMWHSDSSFREVPSFVSIMSAYEVPEQGGETEFASCRAAYARLSSDLKEQIDPLVGIHDYVFSRSKVSPDAVTPSHAASLPPMRQKLVRENPRTGEKNYYIGSHVREIEGWTFDESRSLLDYLLIQATLEKHVYIHRWQPGDLVIWDNRCLIHRGSGYDADRYRRRMRQTRVTGNGPTLHE
tara:strand:+ start:592 stop:1464 length:873 start_codon:yes stop_codon:yes gene_type:complete